MENSTQTVFAVLSEVDGITLMSFLITKLIFTEKRKYTEPDLSGSSKGFDILPPWKLLLGVEMAGINMRIMVHKRQEKGKLMNELKAECVGHRLN